MYEGVYMSMYIDKIIKLICKFNIFERKICIWILQKLLTLSLKIFTKLKYTILKKIQQHGDERNLFKYALYKATIFK